MNLDSNNKDIFDKESEELFSLLKVTWNKPKEEIWETWSKERKKASVITMKPKSNQWILAAAASVVLLLSIGIFMSTYTTSYETLAGEHLTANLPDGSIINLNARSEISYKPYWWWMKRQVILQGESYFEVKKGKKFSVESSSGNTEVLGTSFNIYSRDDRYEVTCISGKVKVQANETKHSVILHPEEKASLQKTGQLIVEEEVNVENTKAWMSNKLVFTSVQLIEVFKEIERQYGVKINFKGNDDLIYSGSFDKLQNVEDVLEIVSRPFELHVTKQNNYQYIITE
ncbi:MAG: FecR family protein [Bacteroidales bacterium]|jgi:ferric-dicitrate binding protein FerR (iron transport regulator)|nr:FecR family protein [Bacteroidales bacterium]